MIRVAPLQRQLLALAAASDFEWARHSALARA